MHDQQSPTAAYGALMHLDPLLRREYFKEAGW
jgi:hypothetical protein